MFVRRLVASMVVPFLLLATLVLAAPGQTSSPRSNRSVPRITRGDGVFKKLHLTRAQRQQVRAIGEETHAARRMILARYRQGEVLTPADRDQLRALGERHNAAIREMLTPEQRTILETHLAVRRAALKQRQGRATSRVSAPTAVEPRRIP